MNAPTQMLIMGHQSSGLVGFLFISPLNPFRKHTVFSSLGRGGALLDRVWFPDTFWETPLPNTWSRTESKALWYGMGKNIGFMGQFCGWDFIDKTGG